jgi:hypothetical protein
MPMMSLQLRALCDQIYGDGTDRWGILLVRSIEIALSDPNQKRRQAFRKLAFKVLERNVLKAGYGPESLEHRAITQMEREWK